MNRFEQLNVIGNRFADLILLFPCKQKILMVADSSLNFGTSGFGLSEFRSIIESAGHDVDTAHRSGSGPNLTIAGSYNFATASKAVNTGNYDQIWLFAFSTVPLSTDERTTLAQFMKNGGGVFATGDHSAIGSGMGTSLPRVRHMRNWSTIPMRSPQRLDTVLEPGADGIKRFNNQADDIPQRIFPVFFSNGGPDNQQSSWNVHPLLRHPSGAVDYLPDHAHESECLAPNPVSGNFAGVEEWPAPSGGQRIRPVVAAVSISAGRFITDSLKPPVQPRCFGAVSAYDGDAAGVGRIVCDATWHHFVNINLNGAGAGTDPATGQPYTGLYSAGAPTSEYLKIQRYFHNTVRWLAPIGRRRCWPFLRLILLRFDYEIAELQLPLPRPSWPDLLTMGRLIEERADAVWGPGSFNEIVEEAARDAKLTPGMSQFLQAQQMTEDENGESNDRETRTLLPVQEVRHMLGGAMLNSLADALPEDEKKIERQLKQANKLQEKCLTEVVSRSVGEIAEHYQKRLKATTRLLKELKTS